MSFSATITIATPRHYITFVMRLFIQNSLGGKVAIQPAFFDFKLKFYITLVAVALEFLSRIALPSSSFVSRIAQPSFVS